MRDHTPVSSLYIGRLAPSSTGFLHLGHAATFLTAHNRARAANGHLILRIDDLDPQRSRDQYIEAAREDLQWLGLTWDTEIRQSHRFDLYRSALESLLDSEYVYPCTCTRKDVQEATQAPHEEDDEPLYNGHCRPVIGLRKALPMRRSGTNYRFRVPDHETITLLDQNQGRKQFTAGCDFGDFLVWRKDGLPSYQLANVVDDADAAITEVVRGCDLLKSTARQILLQHALHLPTPLYFHTELLRDERGERLAKRHDALSLRSLRDSGVTPAMLRDRVGNLMHHKA